ncbi:helix-turn-helix domain-containing protein [Natrialbaceae archaeon GCM10025810]|uniref:ArsR/SmtB family transcription factor n=1 Tax=Halovalidus salilacus TaxID=3075124 RepID=UPI0036237418
MARLFPLRSETPATEGRPRVVDLEGEDADAVFGALSSTTARRIYARLAEEPATPSDVAEAVDSSIQNVRYHLEKLEDAGLVEVVDTWYSSRGNEMSVYATTDGPLIVTADESAGDRVREILSRFLGGVGALAVGSVVVQRGLERYAAPNVGGEADGSAGSTADAPEDDGDGDGGGSEDDGDDGGSGDGDDFTTADAESDETDDGDDSGNAEEDAGADDQAEADDGNPSDGSGESGAEEDAAADGGDAVDLDPTAGDGNGTAENVSEAGEVAEAIFSTVPPGMLFFLGGLVVLLAVTAYWYWKTARPERRYGRAY